MEPLGAALSPSQASRTQGALSTNEQQASSAGPPHQEPAVCWEAGGGGGGRAAVSPLPAALNPAPPPGPSAPLPPPGIPPGGSAPALNAVSPAWGPSCLQVGTRKSVPGTLVSLGNSDVSQVPPTPTRVVRLAPLLAHPGSGS